MAVARPVRDIVPMAGMGGEIEITKAAYNQDPLGSHYYTGRKLEVGQWRVKHMPILADITHSGSNGAILRAKVAEDFKFRLEIPWHAMFVAIRSGDGGDHVGFIEQFMGGLVEDAEFDHVVSIKFNLGDKTSWLAGNRAFLYAPRAKLELVDTICDSTGTNIIRMEVEGSGHSLLRGYHGDKLKFGGEAESKANVPNLPY